MGYLDNTGLAHLWEKVKGRIDAHANDADIHVTAEEKAGWNAGGSAEVYPEFSLTGTEDAPVDLRALSEQGRYYITGTVIMGSYDVTGVSEALNRGVPLYLRAVTDSSGDINVRGDVFDHSARKSYYLSKRISGTRTYFHVPGSHDFAPRRYTVTLSVDGWDATALTQKVTVSGALEDEAAQAIHWTPAEGSQDACYAAGVRCKSQGNGYLYFVCDTIPTVALTIYVTVEEVYAP